MVEEVRLPSIGIAATDDATWSAITDALQQSYVPYPDGLYLARRWTDATLDLCFVVHANKAALAGATRWAAPSSLASTRGTIHAALDDPDTPLASVVAFAGGLFSSPLICWDRDVLLAAIPSGPVVFRSASTTGDDLEAGVRPLAPWMRGKLMMMVATGVNVTMRQTRDQFDRWSADSVDCELGFLNYILLENETDAVRIELIASAGPTG